MAIDFSFEDILTSIRAAMVSTMGLSATHIAETGIDAIDAETAALALPYGLIDVKEIDVQPMTSTLKGYRLRMLIDCYCLIASTPGSNSRKNLRTKLVAFANAVANTKLPDAHGANTCVICRIIGLKTRSSEAERNAKSIMAGTVELEVLDET